MKTHQTPEAVQKAIRQASQRSAEISKLTQNRAQPQQLPRSPVSNAGDIPSRIRQLLSI